MFVKLVVLILVFGGTGIGVLSVRQSRLQAVHEMAESRHRALQLNEQAGEIRSLIVRSSTPQRVHQIMASHGDFVPASSTPAQVEFVERVLEHMPESVADEQDLVDPPSTGTLVFTLSDGTRVVFVDE